MTFKTSSNEVSNIIKIFKPEFSALRRSSNDPEAAIEHLRDATASRKFVTSPVILSEVAGRA